MRNKYSSLKDCISYSLVRVIISKLNIFPNKQTFVKNLLGFKIKTQNTKTLKRKRKKTIKTSKTNERFGK